MVVILPGVEDRFLSSDHRVERAEREFGKSSGDIYFDGRYSLHEPGTSVLRQLQKRLGSLKSSIFEFKADMNRSPETRWFTSKFSSFSRELILKGDNVLDRVSRINPEDVHYCSSAIAAAKTIKTLDVANSEHHESFGFQELSDNSGDLGPVGFQVLSDERQDIGFGLSRGIFSPLDSAEFTRMNGFGVSYLDTCESLSLSHLAGGKNLVVPLDESVIGSRLIKPIGMCPQARFGALLGLFDQIVSTVESGFKGFSNRFSSMKSVFSGAGELSGAYGAEVKLNSPARVFVNYNSTPGVLGYFKSGELNAPGLSGPGELGFKYNPVDNLFLDRFRQHWAAGIRGNVKVDLATSGGVGPVSVHTEGVDLVEQSNGYFRPIGSIEEEVFLGYESAFNEIVALFKEIKADVDYVDGKMNTLVRLIKRFFCRTGIDVGNEKCINAKSLAVFDVLDSTLMDSKLNERLFGCKFASELMQLVKEISQNVKDVGCGVKDIRAGSTRIQTLIKSQVNDDWNLLGYGVDYRNKLYFIIKNNNDVIFDILSHVKQIESSLVGVLDVTAGFNRGFLQEVRHIYRNALAEAGEF